MNFIKEKRKINRVLINFTQRFNTAYKKDYQIQKYVVNEEYKKWVLVRFLFDEIKHFKIYDKPIEKTNWEIPFVFNNKIIGCITHEKFGFRIYLYGEKDKNQRNDFIRIKDCINKALYEARKFIEAYSVKSINKNEILIENKYNELVKQYVYFKKISLRLRKKIKKQPAIKKINNNRYVKYIRPIEITKRQINYIENAACLTFYSLLDHLLVLLYFYHRNSISILDFTQKIKWHQKYKEIFDLNDDSKIKMYYDYLFNLSKYRRNPNAHGLFDKLNSNIYFYLNSAKSNIPVKIFDDEVILEWQNSELNFKKLDDFIKFIKKYKKTKRAMKYIEYNFDIYTDLKIYKETKKYSEKEFDEYLRNLLYQRDQHDNMDW